MFLDYITNIGLLPNNTETNILKDYPYVVKKILVQQVSSFLREPTTPTNFISSAAHLKWAMETCGQGFCLPIDDEPIINGVIELYRKWALDPINRPPVVEEKGLTQCFMQDILRHFSLIFSSRATNNIQLDKHTNLCIKVLDTYLEFGRHNWKFMSLETWEVFLKLMLGIADMLLSPISSEDTLGKRISYPLLKVLFELWIHSRTRNPSLWTAAKNFVSNWFHHEKVIDQWNATTYALTARMLTLLFNNTEKEGSAGSLVISRDDTQIIKMEADFVYYSYYRFLYLIGNPNRLQSPNIFLTAFQGVEKLVQIHLSAGTGDKSRVMPTDGNTILHIYGHWLFQAIYQDKAGFEEGTALAVKILCNIFCSRPKSKFLPGYLSSFCNCMNEALRKDGRLLYSAIINCQELYTHEIEGTRVLLPSFVYAIGRILQKKVQNYDFIESEAVIRRACIKIFNAIFSFPNHFNNTAFQLKITTKSLTQTPLEVENYIQLKQHLSNILIDALKNETSSGNVQLIISTAFAFLCENIQDGSEFAKQVIFLVVRQITTLGWSIEVCITALRVLGMIVGLYKELDGANEQAHFITQSLSKFLASQYEKIDGEIKDKDLENLLSETLYCIGSWVLVETQWILKDRELIDCLVNAIVVAISGKEQKEDESKSTIKGKKLIPKKKILLSEKVREAADYLLFSILNLFGNFPTSVGPSRVSSLLTEEELLQDTLHKSNGKCAVRNTIRYFFVGNSTIISVLDRPYEEGGAGATIIVRDKNGKFAWNTRMSYLPLKLQNVGPLPIVKEDTCISTEPFANTSPEIKTGALADVLSFLDKKKPSLIISNTAKFTETEKTALVKNKFGLNTDIAVSPPAVINAYTGINLLQQSRMFMAHVGFLALENRDRVLLVEQNEKFLKSLQMLDGHSERECHKIGVLYAAKGQTNESEFFSNIGGPPDYQEFVSSLGWGIDLKTHTGFTGQLEKNVSEIAPYHSNPRTEMIFHVATLIPNCGDDNANKKRIVYNNVMVVWAEDLESFKPNFKNTRLYVYIVINPLDSLLYRIRLFQRHENQMGQFGPLTEGMVVSKGVLGRLVRETSIMAFRTVQIMTVAATKLREKVIEDIITTCKKDPAQHPGDVLARSSYGIFGVLPSTESVPLPSATRPNRSLVRQASYLGHSSSSPLSSTSPFSSLTNSPAPSPLAQAHSFSPSGPSFSNSTSSSPTVSTHSASPTPTSGFTRSGHSIRPQPSSHVQPVPPPRAVSTRKDPSPTTRNDTTTTTTTTHSNITTKSSVSSEETPLSPKGNPSDGADDKKEFSGFGKVVPSAARAMGNMLGQSRQNQTQSVSLGGSRSKEAPVTSESAEAPGSFGFTRDRVVPSAYKAATPYGTLRPSRPNRPAPP